MPESLSELWETCNKAQTITLIGAGGKTTALLRLVQELSSRGIKVIATTTTKVYPLEFASVWVNKVPPPYDLQYPCFWYQRHNAEGKWVGPSTADVEKAISYDQLHGQRRVWIIEGDGARSLRLKFWADYEPQIPSGTDCCVLLLSNDLWGQTLQAKDVHRPELGEDFIGRRWDTDTFFSYLKRSPVSDPQYHKSGWVVLFNKVSASEPDALDDIKRIDFGDRPAVGAGTFLRLAAGNVREGVIQCLDL